MKATLYHSRRNENTPSIKKKRAGSDAGGDNAGWVTSEYVQWVIPSSTHARRTDRTPARCKSSNCTQGHGPEVPRLLKHGPSDARHSQLVLFILGAEGPISCGSTRGHSLEPAIESLRRIAEELNWQFCPTVQRTELPGRKRLFIFNVFYLWRSNAWYGSY